ncbi:transporter [Erysipelothrix rhusiopathiae]|nr:transporter [Erysipelothrix rhusiopathiae]MDE8119265.1 transporter [Erysipelothrix rhusiopathiae]MDE8132813.1 transporter [Erysipelothrix rhusiopathiae]MDE8146886.1 transporter [Erysipelothrix rhusiopathiae]MDE8194325.1 transporter [Erysipelothrix rhusiopathiae]
MKNRVKAFSTNVFLIFLIVLTIYIGYAGFIGGPRRAYEREDQLHVEAMMKLKGYQEARLLSRFSLDQVYYITEIKEESGSKIVWFNKALDAFGEHDMVTYEPVYDLAESLDISNRKIRFGVYDDKLVYVLKTKNKEVFVDVDDLSVVFELEDF